MLLLNTTTLSVFVGELDMIKKNIIARMKKIPGNPIFFFWNTKEEC